MLLISETTPDFSPSYTPTDDHQPDSTISGTTRQEHNEIIDSRGTSSVFHEPSQTTSGTSTTAVGSSSSSTTIRTSSLGTTSTSTSLAPTTTTTTTTTQAPTTTTTTRRTTVYIPPETTIPYHIPPHEPSTPDEDIHNEINPPDDYNENNIPDMPDSKPETDTPAVYRPDRPSFNPNNYPGTGYGYNSFNTYNNYGQQQGGDAAKDKLNRLAKNRNARINTEAEERTAMIIGIVAGALIAVILVILLVLWIKSNGDRSYKMEHDLKYGQGANAALLGGQSAGQSSNPHHGSISHGGAASHHGNGSQGQQQYRNGYQSGACGGGGNGYDGAHRESMGMNGSLSRQHDNQFNNSSMGAGLVQPSKSKRNSKDVKEWYV